MDFFRKIFKDKKNFYNLLIILFTGVLLLYFSKSFGNNEIKENKALEPPENFVVDNSYEANLERRLKKTLSLIEGVGQIDVLITLENSKEIVTKDDGYKEKSATTEEATNGDKRQIINGKEETTTVKINGDNPLILKEISPKISGVLIVAQGGGNVSVKKNLINATKALLDVDIHKIEVLKMK